ncbi:MAG: DUF6077 domain-containing protein [Acetatifactor sp.]|nr:DUF6077 domain-containing protein [Acetatifactor sp.]
MLRKLSVSDIVLTGFIATVGGAECAHVLAVFLHKSFSLAAALTLGGTVAVFLCCLAFSVLVARRDRKSIDPLSKKEKWLLAALGCVCLWVFALLISGKTIDVHGDMTVETVQSFLTTDAPYSVNPLTGEAYTAGMPMRLRVLCLPTLYGAFCKFLPVTPWTWIHTIVPCFVFVLSLVAFYTLGTTLFPESRERRPLFLLAVVLLLLAGTYAYGMDGFGLISSGWRGVSLRNLILMPYVFALALRRRYMGIVLCILAEACLVWTLYGLGMCLLTAAGILICDLILRRRISKKEVAS